MERIKTTRSEQHRTLVLKYLFQGNLYLDRIWILVQIPKKILTHSLPKGQRWGRVKTGRDKGVAMRAATNGLLLQTGVLEKAIEGIRNS